MPPTVRIASTLAILLCITALPTARAADAPPRASDATVTLPTLPDLVTNAPATAPAPGRAGQAQVAQAAPAIRPNRAGATNADPSGAAKTGGASGISPNPANDTTGDLTQAAPPLPTSDAPRVGLFPEFGARLLNMGIDVHGSAFDHFLATPTAGILPGHNYNLAAASPAVDFDLQRLLGLPGGNLHTEVTFFGLRSNIPGYSLQTGGFITGAQTTPAVSSDPSSISYFTYEQKLLGDKLSIELGRTNAFRYFEISNSIDPFSYFSSVFDVTADLNSFRFPTWGGRVTYKLTPNLAIQGAAFADNFRKSALNPDALGESGASGVQTFVSLEYRTEFSNATYPANAELGFEQNTRHGYSNIKGTAAYATPRMTAANYPGGGVIFAQGQQVVWRGAAGPGGPPPNIALYGQFDASTEKPQAFDLDMLAGVNFTGLIPGRPSDVLEFEGRYQKLSSREANFESQLRNIFDGPGPRQPRDAYQLEAVANIQVTPAVAFRPLAEYFVHPDSYYDAAQKGRARSGFMFGFFTRVTFGPLLGTSSKPF